MTGHNLHPDVQSRLSVQRVNGCTSQIRSNDGELGCKFISNEMPDAVELVSDILEELSEQQLTSGSVDIHVGAAEVDRFHPSGSG